MAGTVILKTDFDSGSSATIKHTIREGGVDIVPDSVTWTLLNADRAVVNSRKDVVATPGAPTLIFLAPEDLTAIDQDELRYLSVRAVYTSLIYYQDPDVVGGLLFEDGTAWQLEDGDTFLTEGAKNVGRVFVSSTQYRFSVRKHVEEAI